jgi:hypothetical protein
MWFSPCVGERLFDETANCERKPRPWRPQSGPYWLCHQRGGILLPNPSFGSDESYVEFYKVATRMNNIDAGDEMEAPGCGRNSGETLSLYLLQK